MLLKGTTFGLFVVAVNRESSTNGSNNKAAAVICVSGRLPVPALSSLCHAMNRDSIISEHITLLLHAIFIYFARKSRQSIVPKLFPFLHTTNETTPQYRETATPAGDFWFLAESSFLFFFLSLTLLLRAKGNFRGWEWGLRKDKRRRPGRGQSFASNMIYSRTLQQKRTKSLIIAESQPHVNVAGRCVPYENS